MPASSFAVTRLAEVGSTNDWLVGAARAGAPKGTVVVADHQTAGRGRLDRRWEAPLGAALLCSVLLRERLDAPARHLATVAVGLAGVEACGAAAQLGVSLKWPNDLVVEGRKLGGILAETDGIVDDDGAVAIVVGLGVNLTWPGPEGAGGTSVLDERGSSCTRDALLDALLDALPPRVEQLGTGAGRARLAGDYRAALSTIGGHVRVQLADGTFEGTAIDVDDEGHLVVDTDRGARLVTAGDVVHVRPSGKGPRGRPE